MDKSQLWEIVEQMKIEMGVEQLLDELCEAMSSDELRENLEWIDRMHGLDIF